MHYYQFNIGDYRRDTSHLSLLEHGVYRQLLDMYYLSETKIPEETEVVCRRLCARTDDEKKAVYDVLSEFFSLENGWFQTRCDKEIASYQAKSDRARTNGKLGGRPIKTNVVISGLSEETNCKANQRTKEPKNQDKEPLRPENKKPVFDTDDLRFAEFFFAELQKINPEHKKPNLESWAKDARLMRERDGRKLRDAAELVRWCATDPFWKTNILSVAKLREKWDALTMKKNSSNVVNPDWQKRPEFAGMI